MTGVQTCALPISTANLPQAMTTYVNTLNVYDILNAGKVVLTKAAVASVEEVYA